MSNYADEDGPSDPGLRGHRANQNRATLPIDKLRNEELSDARILNQLEHMNDQLAKTQALLRELEDRLDPILMPLLENGADVESPARKLSSAVSNIIDDQNSRISEIQRRVVQIIGRVQI